MIPTYSPAIVYIDLNGSNEPKINFWYPSELSEDVRTLIGIKCSSIISDDISFIPEVLLVFPLPSLKSKMLVKYFDRHTANQEIPSRSALIFVFSEENDVIFYRYMSYIDSYFGDTIEKIKELETNKNDKQTIFTEIVKLKDTLIESTEYLYSKSQFLLKSQDSKDSPTDLDCKVDPQSKYKVVILGDPSVGKTSSILRFTDNVFLRAYIPTMGLNITQKRFQINNSSLELVLWDIGGQHKFETIRKQFYEGASAYVLLFDLTNAKSFAKIPKWQEDILSYLGNKSEITGYLIGNKIDLIKDRIVSVRDGIRLANAMDVEYFESSALTGHNIEFYFKKISNDLLQ
ncbi:MAG: GTP-binding protein [Candidatus Lokiarchaeota archaeon]|nr:GTP-binding protein [Candidatus Lokiarchaeota archaeon]